MTEPRILIYDLETAPNLGYTWEKWDTNVVGFRNQWFILSFAYKWLGEKQTHVLALPDFPLYKKDPMNDRELAKALRELFDQADVTVTHNGITFDAPKAHTRMLVHGIDPPSHYQEVDTLRVARKRFAFTSNRLGDLCDLLGIPSKADPGGFKTWLGCMNGDERAWKRMKSYNARDVVVTEKLYLRFLPWMQTHPNLAALSDRPEACPRCRSTNGMIARGWRHTAATRSRLYQCVECRGYSRGRKTERTSNEYVAA